MILDGARLTLAMFGERLDPREHLRRCYPQLPVPPLDHVVATADPLVAGVDHGIWVARCPCGARGQPAPGGVVFFETPLIWCLRCQNGGTGRGWRPVLVPAEGEHRRIEAVLTCRPRLEDRNWEPGESIDDLLAQNRAHGDTVPDFGGPLGPLHGPSWREAVAPFGRLPAGRR